MTDADTRTVRSRHPVRAVLEPAQRGDVYLVSFPRSGSTWLRCLLTSLVHGTPITPELVATTVPDVHRTGTRPGKGPVLAKTHAPYRELPSKVVYLVRDGRAAMRSYFGYLAARRALPAGLGASHFPAWQGIWPCPWPEHVNGWLDGLHRRPPDRWLVVRYEDLVDDPESWLDYVATFAGIGCRARELQEAVASNTASRLRAVEQAAGEGSLNHVGCPSDEAVPELDLAPFEAAAGPVLRRLGYLR